jgi:BirA family biotin operon repressor/biotin-[acetyl-CoA-carboxylase] ligase
VNGPPPDLGRDRIASVLRAERYGRSLDVRAQTASTMDDARQAAGDVPDGHTIVADRQTAGRGAHGRAWESPGGTDLYFSIVARPPLPPAHRPLLTLAVGLGVADAMEALAGVRTQLKWPNDVWIEGRKAAGILVETSTAGAEPGPLIIGVGVDVNRCVWPDALRASSISLVEASSRDGAFDRAEVLSRLLQAIEAWVDRLVRSGPTPVIDAVNTRLALRGEVVTVDGEEGIVERVMPTGALRLRTSRGPVERRAGTLRRAERPGKR